MQAVQGSLGRVFVLRLEDGDHLPDCLETFAREQNIQGGLCALLGGIGQGKLVVGPEDAAAEKITAMTKAIEAVHEAAAVGTLFPNSQGDVKLHMHTALGRGDSSIVGCIRMGADVWKVAEVVIIEITGTGLSRKLDPSMGIELLSQ